MRFSIISIGILSITMGPAAVGAVKEKDIEYKAGDVTLKGLLAYDDSVQGKRPAVLVVHEWWGHDEHARNSARKLAQAGYVGFALDMYGEGKQAHHPTDAGKMAGEVSANLPVMQARFDAAKQFLTSQANVDPKRIGAIGYCFGGSVVLTMARVGDENLKGVVSFHGGLGTKNPAQPGVMKAKALVLTGADDPFVPKEQVDAFEKEMKAAGADYKLISYPGAKHGFTNPAATENGKKFNLPLEYNADVAKKSWDEMLAFFKKVLA